MVDGVNENLTRLDDLPVGGYLYARALVNLNTDNYNPMYLNSTLRVSYVSGHFL